MLAGYQRFVAYVYEYRKGKKDGSSGYVRVEARGQECRIRGAGAGCMVLCGGKD